ncbi:MAG: D-tyrosyl-tRNA(Tyr) deacylase [Ignavibacteriales bacterium]|nr:D-tyrosyl-tRNA(Tyr) deacylase [Ignavibacteriales bacterium]
MRAVLQRVRHCSVRIQGEVHSSIEKGILIFLGVKNGDIPNDAKYLAERCASLRVFDDAQGKMNLSVRDVQGSAMVVSQFTVYADTRKGTRPNYTQAAPPEVAEKLYHHFVDELTHLLGKEKVASGVFREMMDVELVNDGPVTITLESKLSSQADSPT